MEEVFEMIEETILTDDGVITMYGINFTDASNGKVIVFQSLTSNLKSIQELIYQCYHSLVTETTISDIIYDFICQ
ncbi:MAG: hypothetical protein RSD67_04250 [Oscillospiraceae bacterium]